MTKQELRQALKGLKALVTVSGTDFEVFVSHAEAEALRAQVDGAVTVLLLVPGQASLIVD